jgi:hypothetical protein
MNFVSERHEKEAKWVYTITVHDSDLEKVEFSEFELAVLCTERANPLEDMLQDLEILARAIRRGSEPA